MVSTQPPRKIIYSQIRNIPQGLGWKYKILFELPPPSMMEKLQHFSWVFCFPLKYPNSGGSQKCPLFFFFPFPASKESTKSVAVAASWRAVVTKRPGEKIQEPIPFVRDDCIFTYMKPVKLNHPVHMFFAMFMQRYYSLKKDTPKKI